MKNILSPEWWHSKLLEAAYITSAFENYANAKHYVNRLLNDETFIQNRYFDRFMIFLVIATSIEYVYDIGIALSFEILMFEYLAILIFSTEYILRFWVSSDVHKLYISMYEESVELNQHFSLGRFFRKAIAQKIDFVLKPMSVIDLLAIHPELRPLRLLKLFRYFENTGYLITVFRDKRYEISLLGMIIVMALFISSAMFYKHEYGQEKLSNYFDALYWAVITMGTVGYGDITPQTDIGKTISIILVFVGLSILAMFTSIITTGLEKKLSESKERDSYKSIDKLDSYTIIVGYCKIAADLAQKLKDSNDCYIIIDTNREKIERAKSHGHLAFVYDGTYSATYHSLKINKKVKSVLALTTSDLTNLSIILAVRSLSKTVHLVARANNPENKDKFLIAKANDIVSEKVGAKMLSQFVNAPVAFEAMSTIAQGDKRVAVEEIVLGEINNKQGYIAAENLDLDMFAILLIGVFRKPHTKEEGFDFNPPLEGLRLYTHDIMIVTGRAKNIEGLRLKVLKESAL